MALTVFDEDNLIRAVREAARIEIMPRFRSLKDSEVSTKSGPDDLVTIADLRAEKYITEALQEEYPEALIIGEEAVASDFTLASKLDLAPLAFIIDPIDGTWNFARGLSIFGVILAVSQFGKTVFGMLYDPVMDDWILASNESKACFEIRGSRMPIRLEAYAKEKVMNGYLTLNQIAKDNQKRVMELFPDLGRFNTLRCACHEYRMLAQGHVDFILHTSLTPWDHAAGVFVIQSSGGYVRLLDGSEYSITDRDGFILATRDEFSWEYLQSKFSFLLA